MSLVVENTWTDEARAAAQEAKKAHIHSQIALKGSAGLGIDQPTKRAILTGIDYLGQKNTDQDDSEPPLGRSRSATPEVEHEAYKSLAGHHATVAQSLEKKALETNDSKQRQALLGAARLHWKAVHEHRKAASGLLEHTTETLGRSTIADKVIERAHNPIENAFLRSSTPELAHQKSLEAIAASRKAGWSLESRGPQITEASSGGEHGEAGSLHLHMIGRHEDVADMLDKHPSKESQELALSHREAAKAHRIAADHHLTIYDPPSKEAIERHTLNSDTSRDDLGRFASIEATTHALRASGNIQTLDKNAAVDTALHKVRQMAKRVQSGGRASEMLKGSPGYKGHSDHYRRLEKAHQQATNAHYAAIGKDTPPEIESKHLEAASRHYTAANLAGQAALQQEQVGNTANPLGVQNAKKQPHDSLEMTPEKACLILKDGKANGHKLSKAQRGMFGAKCGERTENRIGLAPIKPRRATAATGGEALTRLQAQKPHVEEDEAEKDRHKALSTMNASTLGAAPQSKKEQGVKRRGIVEDEGENLEHATHSETRNDMEEEEGEEVANALSPDARAAAITAKASLEAGDKSGELLALRRLSGKNILKHFGWKRSKEHDDPEDTARIFEHPKYPGHLLSHEYDREEEQGSASRGENPTDHWHHILHTGESDHEEHTLGHGSYKSALIDHLHKFHTTDPITNHPDEHALIRGIHENPKSDMHKGVYADWLEDRGYSTQAAKVRNLIPNHGETTTNAWPEEARTAAIEARKVHQHALTLSKGLKTSIQIGKGNFKGSLSDPRWTDSKDGWPSAVSTFYAHKGTGAGHLELAKRHEELGEKASGVRKLKHMEAAEAHKDAAHAQDIVAHHLKPAAISEEKGAIEERKGRNTEYDLSRIPDHETSIAKISKHLIKPRTSLPEEHGFLQAIHDQPEEGLNRGAYADWLEEHRHPGSAHTLRGTLGLATHNAWSDAARLAAAEARRAKHLAAASKHLKAAALHDRALLTKGSRQHSVSPSTDKATEASHKAYGQSVGAFPGGNADALTKKRSWLWKGLHMDDSDITHAEVAQQHRDQAAHHLVLAEKKEPVGEVAAKKLNKRNFAGVYTGRTAGGSEWIAANAESELTENTNLDQRGAGGNGPNVPNYLTDHGWSLTHHDPTEGWAELSHQDRPGHILALDHDGSWSHENKEGEELGSGPTHATLITHIEKLRTATKPDTHNSETTMPYTRDNAINYLTTNCECWKGERGKEILNILDEDRLRILYNDMDAVQRVKEAAKDMEEEDEETFEDGNIQASDGTKGGRKTKMVKPDEPIKVVNTAVWLASAPPEIRSVVQNAIAVEQREKASYIVKLVENVSDATKKNEMATRLNKLSIPELKDMMLMLPAQSRPATINSEVNPFLPNYLGASPGATSSQLTENEQADVLDIETARLKYDTVNNARKTQTA